MGSNDAEGLTASGEQALGAGDWEAARSSFEAALAAGDESPGTLYGLGTALYWLAETERAVESIERAYAGFRRAGEVERAAFLAIELSLYHLSSLGNRAAAHGWLSRSARLVADHGLDPLRGWVAICRAGIASYESDPARAEVLAVEALDLARAGGDGDLELCALAERGAALVDLGRTAEGLELLDEAMAGALGGEVEDLGTVIYASCRTIQCCSRAAEIKRALQWIRAADGFQRRYGSAHVHVTCRTYYGAILVWTGRWAEAERELDAALRTARAAEPALLGEALARLAELRLAQGRLDEAGRLLSGLEDHGVAAGPLAALHVARGEPDLARGLLVRRLREVGEQCLGCAELLELLTEVEIERGDVEAASETARRLAALGAELESDLVAARGERAVGRALAASGSAEAIIHLERALSRFAGLELRLDASRTRLLLADAQARSDPEPAIAAARTALEEFEQLGAGRDADRAAALLRSLGVKAARSSGPRGLGVLSKRERDLMPLLAEGLSNREIAERLFLSPRTVEHHVRSVLRKLELANRAEAAAYATRTLAEVDSAAD